MDELVVDKLDKFFLAKKKHVYKKGEILIRAGEQPSEVLYITSGLVKVYSISSKGEEVIVNIFKEGSFFPMNWALVDSENNFFYEALAEVTVYRSDKEDVLLFLTENPDILLDLLKRVYLGVEGVLDRLSYVMGEDAQKRLLLELIISTKRFGQRLDNDMYLLHLSEKDLAAQTGLTRETISREVKKLKEDNLVVINKDQTITLYLSELEALNTR